MKKTALISIVAVMLVSPLFASEHGKQTGAKGHRKMAGDSHQ